jgi:KDO2-lipid IV(A) lauroyltransferase
MTYLLLKCLLYPIGLLPRWALCLLSEAMSFIVYRIVGYRKKVVRDNLHRCFPNLSVTERHRIARRFYRNLCDMMLNLLRIRFASQKRILRSVRFLNPEVMIDTQNQDGIVFAGHFSCWEYIGVIQRYLPQHQTVAAYQPSRGALDKIITESRARFGAIMTPLAKTFRVIFEHRNAGRRTYTLMVTDQSPTIDSSDLWVTFLGQRTLAFSATERIAQKISSKVLYLRVYEVARFRYDYEFVVLSPDASQEETHSVTRRFFEELEKDILRCPHLWMWSHRRWKHTPAAG